MATGFCNDDFRAFVFCSQPCVNVCFCKLGAATDWVREADLNEAASRRTHARALGWRR
jgi:hypothetical protein